MNLNSSKLHVKHSLKNAVDKKGNIFSHFLKFTKPIIKMALSDSLGY